MQANYDRRTTVGVIADDTRIAAAADARRTENFSRCYQKYLPCLCSLSPSTFEQTTILIHLIQSRSFDIIYLQSFISGIGSEYTI